MSWLSMAALLAECVVALGLNVYDTTSPYKQCGHRLSP